ncbi:hypothetical protein MNBD_GAMMA09-3759 [hydrothermal vent metagenome]|uniref:Glyoxalase/fosfomycin resistance/dioxygenase domain-containing protein n=1 Tax=hydrothermal vent metagenome TaxID=652676 RepID=A0A3B0Y262_9ZZZZ
MRLKNAINWFEIPVSNYERAIDFYEVVMDVQLKREKMGDIDLAIFPADEEGIAGALIKADFQKPDQKGCLVYLNAEGMLDEVMKRAMQKGGDVYMEKTGIGENGFIAHIGDSEGNKIALHSMTE